MARVATNIQRLPGIGEIGLVPDARPPAILVRFDPEQTSVQDIAQQARIGLESDTFVPTAFAVSLVPAEPALLAVSLLNPIRYFDETDLLVRILEPGMLRLSNEIFGCGTCINSMLFGLPKLDGVQNVSREPGPSWPEAVVVFDPSVISAEQIAWAAKEILETDELLGSTITIHFLAD